MVYVTWILDEFILEKLTYSGKGLPDVIREQGHGLFLSARADDGSFPGPEVLPDGPVVLYGSHEFVKRINPDGRYQPGHLGVNERTRSTQYMSNLPLDWFLNRDAKFITWAMFKHRAIEIFDEHQTDLLFIRPDSGYKTFAGQRVQRSLLDDDISTLEQISGVMSDTLIMVNPGIEIQGEFRFVVADKNVIAGSEYRWDGKLDVRRDWPQDCWDLAQQVAQHEWQVDISYTCDVALTSKGPRIVELNGFSCAGLYACDLGKVVDGVSRAAAREWAGDDL